jgi:putative copper export protein
LQSGIEQGIDDGDTCKPLSALKISILIETGIAVMVLTAVGVLGTLAPPISGD